MKQTIKNFLFKKRIKILKSKKGFSLLEVLVAVAIIGIVSAIAVPSYKANRKAAAQAAGSTSILNIKKAYQNCVVLNTFTNCDSLSEIGVECTDCTEQKNDSDKFCISLVKTSGGEDMKACISVDVSSSEKILTTMGGTLLTGTKLCKDEGTKTGGGGHVWDTTTKSEMTPIKNCKVKGDCGTDSTTPLNGSSKRYYCELVNKQGVCASNACT